MILEGVNYWSARSRYSMHCGRCHWLHILNDGTECEQITILHKHTMPTDFREQIEMEGPEYEATVIRLPHETHGCPGCKVKALRIIVGMMAYVGEQRIYSTRQQQFLSDLYRKMKRRGIGSRSAQINF